MQMPTTEKVDMVNNDIPTGTAEKPGIQPNTECDTIPPPVGCGRMTGGGSVFFGEPRVRVTRGFEIHCDLSVPNNLEVNWQGGKKFHLIELTGAICTEDPNIIQYPPAAPFDTFEGWGIGKYNNHPGATIHFVFIDAGEPGSNDWASIEVEYGGSEVLNVAGYIDMGNLQAHAD